MSDYRAYDRERDRDRDYSPPRRGGGGGGGGYSSPGRDYSPTSRDEPRRHKSSRTIPRGRGDPEYIEETTFIERGKGAPPRELVPRRRSSSIEDIPRDFPPPSRSLRGYRDDYDDRRGGDVRRARSSIGGRSRYDDDFSDEDDYRSRRGGGRRRDPRDRDDGYYSEDYERETRRGGSRSPKRKSGVEGLLAGLGLGGVAGALTGGGKDKGKDRSRSRSRHGGRRGGSSSRSRSPKGKKERQWAQAAQAAIVAGAVEAFRSRKEPGSWTGEKGKRIATAAIGAGGIDRLIDRDPDDKSKRHLAQSVMGGLAANRLANGPNTERERSVDSRGRSISRPGLRERSRSVMNRFRSKSRGRSRSVSSGSRSPRARSKSVGAKLQDMGGIQKALAGGAVAAAGKAIYDRVRSKSRGAKDRRRSRSDSEDSYVASRNRRRDVGLSSQRGQGLGPNLGAVMGPTMSGAAGAAIGTDAFERGATRGRGSRSNSSDSESSTDLENKRKKMRGKEFLTAGLASIATIHAAHGVYQSMSASENRHKLVAEGEMSPEEARKKRSKAWLQDAAAVGIAALGIKGAYSEWKEMNEQRHSVKELEERREQRHKRRDKRMREMKEGLGDSGGGGGRERRSRSEDDYDDRRYDRRSDRYDDGPYSSSGLPPPPISAGGYR